MNQMIIMIISATLVLTWRPKKNDRGVVFQIIKVILKVNV